MDSIPKYLTELTHKIKDCELKAAELRLKGDDCRRAAKGFEDRAEGFRREREEKVKQLREKSG